MEGAAADQVVGAGRFGAGAAVAEIQPVGRHGAGGLGDVALPELADDEDAIHRQVAAIDGGGADGADLAA